MTKFMSLCVLLVVSLTLGCSSATGNTSSTGGAGGGTSTGGTAGQVSITQWQTCTADADCVVLPQGTCCGCVPVGINQDHEAEARAQFALFDASNCPPLGCPAFPCPPDPVPVCSQGTCNWTPGCSARSESDCETDGLCMSYAARRCDTTDPAAFVACSTPMSTCDASLTCALSPAAIQYQFSNGCVPEGWMACPSTCN